MSEPSQPASTPEKARRVLVVGIDGVRHDVLLALPTPHIDAVAAAGFLAAVEVADGTPTMSGPCWATITTGVTVDKHAVWSNDFSGNRLRVFPDFATRLARQDGRRTYVAAGWDPLVTVANGGPLFAHPSRLSYSAPAADTPQAWEDCDEQITEDAVRVLGTDDSEASFVYLGAPDETAHFLGCGAEYERSVVRADERLGRILAAVRHRAGYDDETWTVIVVTDHGHVRAGGHGGRSGAERTAWVACSGPDVTAGRTPDRVRHEDVAAHVYAALGRTADRHWTLDGRPFTAAPRAVLFDMDGTLVDTESLWWQTVAALAQELGHELGDADLPAVLGRSVHDTAAHLHDVTGTGREPAGLAAELDRRFLAAVQERTVARPGAVELLDLLEREGVPVGLVSASPRSVMDAVLKTLGAYRFQVTVAEGETPATKPAPDPYLAAAGSLGVPPAACVAVEDTPVGVASAEAAGCVVLAVPSLAPIPAAPGRTVRGSLEGIDFDWLRTLVAAGNASGPLRQGG
ncbi:MULTISPECIES: HAD-IA family hydrolase [Streptomyces]|uniref:HAD-IA family hydrolase n=1 Tax=Streptomyces TaxID=1883 RepID=UPI0018DF02DF|nr:MULTISPECIES: HAD-IA family hydrolase [Streptomyces]MCZ4101442.1 HAD-IA family hydrolase [Streptomyces sp. H39-C1]